jgi:hypothetical protein
MLLRHATLGPPTRRDLAVGTEMAPLCGVIKTSRLGGKEDMAPEPASDQRDTVKDTELIVSVLNGDIDRIHRMVLAALGDPSPNMQVVWGLNFEPANEERLKWVWPLTYGSRLLGAGGLLLGVVVARLLLG